MTLLFLLPDVDECGQGDLCLGGVCANTEGSYTCTRCKAGYRVSQDRQRCEGKFQPAISTVMSIKDLLNTSVQFANSPLKFLLNSPHILLNIYSDAHACLCWCACASHRYWWVPVLVYLCQRDLSKLRRLLHLWELPNRVQSIIWRGALWRLVCSTPLI